MKYDTKGRFTVRATPVLLLATALLVTPLLVACGGGGGGGGGGSAPPPPQNNPPREGALSASQPGELMSYVRAKLGERQAQRALNPGIVFVPSVGGDSAGLTGVAAPAVAAATAIERSGTPVQEQGVDEEDLIKTDGTLLFTLAPPVTTLKGDPGADLRVHRRRADGGLERAGGLPVLVDPEVFVINRGMLHASAANRVLAVGESTLFDRINFCPPPVEVCIMPTGLPVAPQVLKVGVHLDLVNVGNPAQPAVSERVRIDGRLVGVRQIGNIAYIVTQHVPQLAIEALPASATAAERDAQLARLTVADVLPTIRIGNAAPVPLLAETDCWVQPKNGSLGIELTSITAIDLTRGISSRTSRCFAGGSEALYMSPSSLYLATSRFALTAGIARFPAQTSMDIHKFALSQMAIDYRGSGEVEGHLGWEPQSRSYRMSEWGGDLRVITFTGQTGWIFAADATTVGAPAPSPATLTILRERASDRSLQTIGKLPNTQRPAPIGKPNEQVYAVRFVGNRGYVVTFRRTDPLYVLDLANPADPRTVGELEIPGFSNYLFPVADGLLLGVGKEADERGQAYGVKLTLFDVANPAQPRLLGSQTLGTPTAFSLSGLDLSRHGIDLFTRGSLTRVALPVAINGNGRTPDVRGLQKFEVDATARTLRQRELIPAADPKNFYNERSVQIDNHVYYLAGPSLTAHAW